MKIYIASGVINASEQAIGIVMNTENLEVRFSDKHDFFVISPISGYNDCAMIYDRMTRDLKKKKSK